MHAGCRVFRPSDHIDMAPVIDDALVRRVVTAQFPQWSSLPVRSVETAGWDNGTFRLGEHMIVRLPRTAAYAVQVEKEQRWLSETRTSASSSNSNASGDRRAGGCLSLEVVHLPMD
jgi:hypothetical protein